MTIDGFVKRLRAAGARLTVRSDGLVQCTGPAAVVTPGVLAAVARHAPAIQHVLMEESARSPEAGQVPVGPPLVVCHACWSRSWWTAGHDHWICGVCHPPAPGVIAAGVQWSSQEIADVN